jgi:hypothetical protein
MRRIKKFPYLSIIIPTLNEEECLPRLLKDLSQQIFQDFEVIVVDGQSDDSTAKKARNMEKLLPAFKLIKSPKRNVCSQRNMGAKAAKAKTLVFVDADCRLDPAFLLGLSYRWQIMGVKVLSFWIKPDEINRQNESVSLAVNLFRELQNTFKPMFLLESLFAVDKHSFLAAGGFDETVKYAEGSRLIKSLTKNGCISKIVRDPAYTFSLRRLRELGLLKMASTMARLELSNLIGKDYQNLLANKLYPMNGGQKLSYNPKAKTRFMTKINQLLEQISNQF